MEIRDFRLARHGDGSGAIVGRWAMKLHNPRGEAVRGAHLA
jgi:hypothetical protein